MESMTLLACLLLAQSTPAGWFNAGLAHHANARYDDALHAFEQAAQGGYQPAFAPLFRRARALAMKKETTAAFDALRQAAAAGFSQLPFLLNDPDLAALRGDPRFGPVARQIDLNGKPCLKDPRYREFDFWIGDWAVTNTGTGAPAGENDVLPLLDGCGLMENWSPTNGNRGRGKSFNFLDPATRQWRQLYLADNGLVVEFTGEWKDGAMRFTRQTKAGQERMIFTPLPAGQVRQLWELSADGGRTWTALFDGTYTRKRAR